MAYECAGDRQEDVRPSRIRVRTDAPAQHVFSFRIDRFSQEWVLSKDGKELPHRLEFALVK